MAYAIAVSARRSDGADAAAVALLHHVGLGATTFPTAVALGGDPVAAGAVLDRLDPRDLGALLQAAAALGTGTISRAWSAGAVRPVVVERYTTGAEVAGLVGAAFGVPDGLLAAGYERWDGRGFPGLLRGGEIPVPVRIAQVAEVIALHGADAPDVLRARAGTSFDPALVEPVAVASWAEVPGHVPALADAPAAAGSVADLPWPARLGHSAAVARAAGPDGWLHELGGPVSAAVASACAAWTPPADDLLRLAIRRADPDQLARFLHTSPRKARAAVGAALADLGVGTLGGAAYVLGAQ